MNATPGKRAAPTLLERLRWWAEVRKVRPVEEDPGVAGGREAEDLLARLVGSSYEFKGARLFGGRRIPSRRQGRRREIDLIVCTPRRVHLIEVKNWSGRLDVAGGSWRQTRRGGDMVDHGDLTREGALRREAVAEYLEDCGVSLGGGPARDYIVPEIMFMNPRLELDPGVEARPDVFSRRELDAYLGRHARRGAAEGLFSSLIDYFLDAESKRDAPADTPPAATYEKIVDCLARAPTWDRAALHGTRVVTGDVIHLRVGGRTYRRAELAELAAGTPVAVRRAKNPAYGLFLAVTGLWPVVTARLGALRLGVGPEDSLFFHAVGDREPSPVRLVELDRIELG